MRFYHLLFVIGIVWFIQSCKVSDYQSDARPVTHELWDSLVREHVTESGLVDYEGFIADSNRLNQYLDLLSRHHPNDEHWNRDERLAYWINAYNAFTVKLIVDHYPVESIKDIKNGIPFVNTVWDIKFIKIEGREYDLNNIEHGIIRPKFDEPRIHMAVNCAAISCPKLQNEAYTAEKLGAQLDQASREFLSNEDKNVITPDRLKLSKIFSWYRGDFDSVIEFVDQHTETDINENPEVEYLDYNWALNGLE
jgi:hypothetical protein